MEREQERDIVSLQSDVYNLSHLIVDAAFHGGIVVKHVRRTS